MAQNCTNTNWLILIELLSGLDSYLRSQASYAFQRIYRFSDQKADKKTAVKAKSWMSFIHFAFII